MRTCDMLSCSDDEDQAYEAQNEKSNWAKDHRSIGFGK